MYNEKLLKIAIDEGMVKDFFKGTNGFKIMNPNGSQENTSMQNYGKVVDIFHSMNSEHPEYELPTIFQDTVYELLKSDDTIDIYTVLNILDAEMFKEEFPSATFKLKDMENILLTLKNQLIRNKNKLSTTVLSGDPMSVWELSQMYLSDSLSEENIKK